MKWIDKIHVSTFLVIALTLGLAPFMPEPHVWEKLKMLVNGELVKAIDIFDLFMHGTPWLLLLLKMARLAQLANSKGA